MAKPSAFQFSNPILEHINFNLNGTDNGELETGELSLEFGTTDFEDDGSGGKSAKARLIISNQISNGNSKNLPYDFSVTYTAMFHWNTDDISDEQATKYLFVNGQALLLSYFRPIINTIVRASGAPNFNLPFIDFTDDQNFEKE